MKQTYPKSLDVLQSRFTYRYHYEKPPKEHVPKQVYFCDKWARLELITTTCTNALKVLYCMALSPHWARTNPQRFNQTLNKATTELLNSDVKEEQQNALMICSLLYQQK